VGRRIRALCVSYCAELEVTPETQGKPGEWIEDEADPQVAGALIETGDNRQEKSLSVRARSTSGGVRVTSF
jgi:hypothetical protein